MTKFSKSDIAIGTGVVALALVGILVLIPMGIIMPGGIDIAALSPSFWPKIVLIGLAIAGVIILFQGFFPSANDADDEEFSEFTLPWPIVLLKLIISITVLFSYYFAIEYFGIVVSSIATLVALMLLGGEKRMTILLPVAIALPVLLYFFFTYVANVPLPLGMFES